MIAFLPSGDSAFLVRFGNEISEETHRQIRGFVSLLSASKIKGIVELVPAYGDVLVHYDPLQLKWKKLLKQLKKLAEQAENIQMPTPEVVKIPVCYDEEFATDIKEVERQSGLTREEVVQIHCSRKYLVYMLGFTPGFCYLGGMDERIATARKEKPALKISAGSVGIAGEQTGIYPIDSPGGWQIIGKTPLKMFDPLREKPFLVEAGCYLEFYRISKAEYDSYDQNN